MLGFRGRRAGPGLAIGPALALHVACLGALLGIERNRTATPSRQEAVIELAMALAPEPPAPPEPATPSPPAASPIDEPVLTSQPEPIEAAVDPVPVDAPPPAPPEAPPAEIAPAPPSMAAMPAPPPESTPLPRLPTQPAHAPARPHTAAATPRAAAHRDTAASATPADPAAATPAAVAPQRFADQEASFEARIRDAVQAAVHYPASARMMGVTGRARVLLDYRGGSVAGPVLTQSSGTPTLDDAALTAARTAHYPPAPAEIEGRLLRLLVWVEFKSG